jgi:hypothetical protein
MIERCKRATQSPELRWIRAAALSAIIFNFVMLVGLGEREFVAAWLSQSVSKDEQLSDRLPANPFDKFDAPENEADHPTRPNRFAEFSRGENGFDPTKPFVVVAEPSAISQATIVAGTILAGVAPYGAHRARIWLRTILAALAVRLSRWRRSLRSAMARLRDALLWPARFLGFFVPTDTTASPLALPAKLPREPTMLAKRRERMLEKIESHSPDEIDALIRAGPSAWRPFIGDGMSESETHTALTSHLKFLRDRERTKHEAQERYFRRRVLFLLAAVAVGIWAPRVASQSHGGGSGRADRATRAGRLDRPSRATSR